MRSVSGLSVLQAVPVAVSEPVFAGEAGPVRSWPLRGADMPTLRRQMCEHLDRARPRSDSEALKMLRQAFPATPLALRVAALAGRPRVS
ncbi:MAG TPA: transferase [Xanthobacteraceae bacterium]|nr:transferase [Xanthobacteraceae bacterium]